MLAAFEKRRRRFPRLAPAEGLATMTPAMETADRYFEWIYETFASELDGRVLEVGSGYGVFAQVLARRHGSLIATDRDPASLAVLERRFAGDSRVAVRRLDILDTTSVEALARSERVDAVVSQNVLEHIADDVRALEHMGRLVRPGGRVVVFVPALESLYGSLDRLAGHFRRYDRRLIAGRLEAAGLRPLSVRYFNFIGALGWFWNACVCPQTRLDSASVNGQVKVYDRWIVPLSAALERRISPPFGQSVLAVAERPAT